MTNGRPDIVIEGTFDFSPGDTRTFTALHPERDTERHAFRFGAELDPGNNHVWFRITPEAIDRMREQQPEERGDRLVAALITWLGESADNQLENVSEFQVSVSNDVRVEVVTSGAP